MRHAFGVILVFVVGSVQAATVDFEEIDVFGIGSDGQEVYNPGTPLESGGLLFTSSPTSRNIHVNGKDFVDARSYLSFANNGSNYLSSYTNSGDYALSISSANSNYFSLTSIDLAEYWSTSFPSYLDSILIEAYTHNGQLLSLTFDLDNIVDGADGAEDFQTLAFDSIWSDLAWVRLGPADGAARNIFNIDNVVYQASIVPIPAAAYLFASGLHTTSASH